MSTTEELLNVLEDLASLLQKTQVNLKKCPKQRLTRGYIETRIKTINDYWSQFQEAHNKLVKITPKDQKALLPYFVNEDFFIYEDLYIVMESDLRDLLSTSNHELNTSGDKQTLVKLPRMELPTFSGSYESWPTFQDMFLTLVHNNVTLSDVEKLHYLKTSCTAEAESLLRHIQVTNANYTVAWKTLKDRYGNNRLIVNSVLKRLFNQKKMNTQSAQQLKCLFDTTMDCLNNLNNLKINTDSWDPVIIFLVVQKLDPESHKDWEEFAYKDNSNELPMWNDLKRFLESKYRTLELVTLGTSNSTREKVIKERTFHAATSASSTSPSEKICFMCKENHTLCHCKEFIKLQPSERIEYVRNNNLCFNCLVPGHAAHKCRLSSYCRICKKQHHSLLHISKKVEIPSIEYKQQDTASMHTTTEEQEEVHVNTKIASNYSTKPGTALLATAMVTVRNENNHSIVLRALIDQGSQASFISEKAAQVLKLKRQPAKGWVVGVGSTRTNIKHVVQIQVHSRLGSNVVYPVQAYVMSKPLTTKIPTKTMTANNWIHLEGLELADPTYLQSGPVDLLLGVKEYSSILEQELIKGPPGTPCAQKTSLGWILFGEIDANPQEENFLVMHHQIDVDDMLKSLWEVDTDTKRKLTREEKLCEEIYDKTISRTEEGRYIVKLPFNTGNPKSPEGNTREIAQKRLLQLERRFEKFTKLKEDYAKVMKEYETLGHIEEVPVEELKLNKSVYLPHHAVVREDKETSKTRVVFDASCKGTNNVSLNDELLIGPQLQEDLRNIIMRWRMKRICYTSDIQQMYRQILTTKEDADFQRILWRYDTQEKIRDYRLLRVTFGTACAPYLAVKTLQQVAEDEGKAHPMAAQTIKEDFYMDDLMSGNDSVGEAIDTAKQIKDILKRGGFKLSKWSSNNVEFLKSFDPCERSANAHIDLNVDGTVRALGVQWNLANDEFQYNVNLPPVSSHITKRNILSDIQKMFDPLGWIAPSIIMAKILIQKLWLKKCSWDDEIEPSIADEWLNIRSDLDNMQHIGIERWLNTLNSDKESIQIHGFSDASMRAYAAAVYVRVVTLDGSIKCKLIAARSKVAPLRTVSLPRLELCGALLLSQLMKQVSKAMRIPSSQMYSWTDSSIVIAWLSGDPHQWKPFVANRVVEIIENIGNQRWYHVQSHENPADIASRGMLLAELIENKLWWQGPVWLSKREIQLVKPETIQTDIEKKETIQTNLKTTHEIKETGKELTAKFENFDTLPDLLKSITMCRRFINFKRKPNEINNILQPKELEDSLNICIKLVQEEEYYEEIQQIKDKGALSSKSKLKSLNPYLDENNILRVGGRLRHANMNEQSKHPIILGNKNNLTPLIVQEAHVRTLHGGVQLMLCYLRSKYWIIRGKGAVKFCIRRCLTCAKERATTKSQLMGDLPKERVTPQRPFTNSGVDFAGPLQVLMSKGRGAKTYKAYICIFVCMATKAVHLELVGDLTSEAFIAAFNRFVARRGKCSHMWSDQGRNFVGADKELAEAWRQANLEFTGHIANTLALDGTQWHFIPAYSPHFGGLWEAGVKSIKYHLKRILTAHLTFEEMSTVLCQIEACLNSRPLTPIDDLDADATEPLTPGHFLIGEAPIIVPSPDFKDINTNRLTRWQHTKKLLGDFWRRWQQEYLTRLQQRPKWLKREKEFNRGDIVLIKTEGLPPGKWALGRIVEKHPGDDGFTRVYSVKSGSNIVKRPVTKLCELPIETDL